MIDILKQNDLEEFFDKKYRNNEFHAAYGMITPTQHIEVCNIPDLYVGNNDFGTGSHTKTYLAILNRIYNLGVNLKENKSKEKEIKLKLNEMGLLYAEGSTSICIRYSNEKICKMVVIKIPALINLYQELELIKLNDFFKSINLFNIHIEITNINPLLQKESSTFNKKWFEPSDEEEEDLVEDLEFTQIDYALKFMHENNRISNFVLPTTEMPIVYDIPLEEKNKSLK